MADIGDKLGLGALSVLGHMARHNQHLVQAHGVGAGIGQVFQGLLEVCLIIARLIGLQTRLLVMLP